jgi:hypothetical protein
VFRSNKHISGAGHRRRRRPTLAAASTNEADLRAAGTGASVDAAARVGQLIAERAKAAGIDRSCSTAAASPTTAASPPWPTPPVKQDWSSDGTLTTRDNRARQPRRP